MPLMKVIREDNGKWQTVDHLNFKYLGIGKMHLKNKGDKIQVYEENNQTFFNEGEEDKYNHVVAYQEDVDYLKNSCMPQYFQINTSMRSTEQQTATNVANSVFNTRTAGMNPADVNFIKKGFLLEHRTLTDKSETFHVLHFWNGTAWEPLHNIWG